MLYMYDLQDWWSFVKMAKDPNWEFSKLNFHLAHIYSILLCINSFTGEKS